MIFPKDAHKKPSLVRPITRITRRRFVTHAVSVGALCTTGLPALACNLPTSPTTNSPTSTPTSGKLRYDPGQVANLGSNVRTINVASPGTGNTTTVNLTANTNYKIVLPQSSIYNGRLFINGAGNNTVWIIGGQIRHAFCSSRNTSSCLDVINVRKLYVEGVRIDRAHYPGDAIILRTSINSSGTLVEAYFQNVLVTGVNYMHAGGSQSSSYSQHGDIIQCQSQVRAVNIDMFTGYSWGQGWLVNQASANTRLPGAAVIDGCNWSRMNLVQYDRELNPGTSLVSGFGLLPSAQVLYYLSDSCSAISSRTNVQYIANEVYAADDDNDNPSSLLALIAPGSAGQTSCPGTITSNQYSNPQILTGVIKGGRPPNGDFVGGGKGINHTDAFTGLNYVSPGYL